MNAAKEFAKLKMASTLPEADAEQWLGNAKEGVDFLIDNAKASDVLLYASLPCGWVHAVFTPVERLTPPDPDDLLRAHFDGSDSWKIQRAWGGGQGHRIYLEPPMDSPGCKSLVGSEKIIYRRSFHGMANHKAPTEISQKLVHALGLHFIEERHAYCRLNEDGDLEDVITVFEQPSPEPFQSITAVFITSYDLAQYLALSGAALFRKFDFTRYSGSFGGWSDGSRQESIKPDLAYHSGFGASASYVNGYQILRTTLTVEQIIEEWKASEDPSLKQYETFKVHDWKNNRLIEVSSAPGNLSNYFQKSDNPYELSPAFFRPEVLHKYKADPDKYTIEHRSISCRNSWHLKTYDVNEEGQVHTYIGYLADLPYSEQQYWKLYNEWPKGTISKRAIQTDFEGNFSTDPDPLMEIEYEIEDVERKKSAWWSASAKDLRTRALYPTSTSAREWADEILALDQLLVEGFHTQSLKKLAVKAGARLDPQWASLRVIEECLVLAGITSDDAKAIVSPLRELHNLRSKVKGHATAERRALEVSAQRDHGSFRTHFTDLAQRCLDSFRKIVPVLDALT